jgi:phenylpyruvate tautomerase PptA (4-oxalocrotonate tautomerase family)
VPMIDIYATAGTFSDVHRLAADAAAVVKDVERVPDIAMFRQNTGAFVHEMPVGAISDVDGDSRHVRVQVLTNPGALDREKQLEAVKRLTDLVAAAANDPSLLQRTWVLLTEAVEGGWGLWGHAHTNQELVEAVRAEIARTARPKSLNRMTLAKRPKKFAGARSQDNFTRSGPAFSKGGGHGSQRWCSSTALPGHAKAPFNPCNQSESAVPWGDDLNGSLARGLCLSLLATRRRGL